MLSLIVLQITLLFSTAAFAPEELIFSAPPPPQTFSQFIQLERGWNLVSWYVVPTDPNTPPLTFDDLFNTDSVPWGPQSWFDSDRNNPILDWVGKYDGPPQTNPPTVYPWYGWEADPGGRWQWDFRQAYYIHLNSPAHSCEFTNSPRVSNPSYVITPSYVWDDSIAPNVPPNYWYFLPYPLRMEIPVLSSSTITALATDPINPMVLLKSDDGKFYQPNLGGAANLVYLEPGRGYFAGFRLPNTLQNPCLNFAPEFGSEPQSLPPQPPDNKEVNPGTFSLTTPHFTFKSGTHWWYPVVIDTVNLIETPLEAGDEIAVFDGPLCVGATAYSDSFPIIISAWKDDVASPATLDGYRNDNEMIFKWFDVSTNQEITFVLPPTTQAADDPISPTHSGFGHGFLAKRSLVDGIAQVLQLPREFKLGQNYPNPFNADTNIPLELPERSQVKIELYNLCGQRVATLFDGVKNAGVARLSYRADNLASGMYFVKVNCEGLERTGRFTAVEKIILLK